MIIAHAPAGIILSAWLQRTFAKGETANRYLLLTGAVGAVIPDFDMIYFYLLDQRQHHHHTYWTHYPVFWLVLALLSYIWFENRYRLYFWCFFLNVLLHLLLDSIVGDIWWLAPWQDKPFSLFTVPAVYQPWWLNFILHWSFGVELFLSGWALMILKKQRRNVMVKTATFEALLESVVEDGDGWLFTLEGKTYRITDKDEVRKIAESHGYILIY